jgi:hypothetical protein
MTTNELGSPKTRQALGAATGERSPQPPQAKSYESPELHELGTLAKLQHIGCNWRDGIRYKDDPTGFGY